MKYLIELTLTHNKAQINIYKEPFNVPQTKSFAVAEGKEQIPEMLNGLVAAYIEAHNMYSVALKEYVEVLTTSQLTVEEFTGTKHLYIDNIDSTPAIRLEDPPIADKDEVMIVRPGFAIVTPENVTEKLEKLRQSMCRKLLKESEAQAKYAVKLAAIKYVAGNYQYKIDLT